MTDIPDELVNLERSCEAERARLAGLCGEEYDAQWRAWRGATEAFQAALSAYAAREGVSRYELEQSVKEAVRHTQEDPAP
ncbi:hypothetical protein GCM10010300_53500 [Streptomyces olivaceoviridis]|uniref:hypothetical protein n=1 Tax=Streptomyces olivaceoviridis TaxID=1921 RepID=UPI0019AC4806|nr:hypothetical protein [Streptomyces olivaceoviridis]GGZ02823.1 hypothetical protein GCM10010300_53500 [Streptomyces olivaceoviridis]